MKSRLCFAAALVFAVVAAPVVVQAQTPVTQPLVTVTGITVNSITAQAGQLVANATVALNVVGRTVNQNVAIPLSLTGSPAATPGTCDILHLSLGPINLNLLGLVVNLDDCHGGPVVVDITATPAGGLLGQLLCDLAGLLNNGVILTPAQLASLLNGTATSPGLPQFLNQLFANRLAAAGLSPTTGAPSGTCPILNLTIPQGLNLSILGLNVDTSPICLNIYAQPGPGNLLGNLLCSLADLLNNNGNNGHAQQVLVRNILALLNRLGL